MPSNAMKKPALQRNKSMDKGIKVGGKTNLRKPKAQKVAKGKTRPKASSAKKQQGYNARLDESLGMRKGKASSKKQGYKSRRDESKGMEKAMGRRAYASVGTMDKGKKKRG
jgi:hypothetical protein